MKRPALEVDLGDEYIDRVRAIRKFQSRQVEVVDSSEGKVRGINVGGAGHGHYQVYTRVKPVTLQYDNLEKMTLLSPKKGDENKLHHSYLEVTENTIAMTTKWAKNGYRA